MKIPYLKIPAIPIILWSVGLLLNAIAVAANHGHMPVLSRECTYYLLQGDTLHTCFTPHTRLKFLCDWILIPGQATYSVGDILIMVAEYIGGFCLGVWTTLLIREHKDNA